MNDDDYDPAWDLDKVKPVTRSLLNAIALDVHPTPAASNDFGIASQAHYEAIYYPVRNDEISFAKLDAAYGNGAMLTELVNAAPSNPHKGIVFETPWDQILPRGSKATPRNMDELRAEAAKQATAQGQAKGRQPQPER